jgi:hypothetical protein
MSRLLRSPFALKLPRRCGKTAIYSARIVVEVGKAAITFSLYHPVRHVCRDFTLRRLQKEPSHFGFSVGWGVPGFGVNAGLPFGSGMLGGMTSSGVGGFVKLYPPKGLGGQYYEPL